MTKNKNKNKNPSGDLTDHHPPSVGLSCQHEGLKANCFLPQRQGLTNLDQPSSGAFLWEVGSLAKSNFSETPLMGSHPFYFIWQNESNELTLLELSFDEGSWGSCVQKHTRTITTQKKEKKKFSESQSLFQGEGWESGCGGDLTFRVHLLCSNIFV